MMGHWGHGVVLVVSIVVALGGAAQGQSLDAASAEALTATLRVLQDPTARAAAIAGSPQAGAADQQIQSLAGIQLTPEVYALAAEVFGDLVRSSGGDVARLTETLARAQRDPAAFAATLSPTTLRRLRELSIKISERPR